MSAKYIELAPGGRLGVTAVFEIDGKRTFLEAEAIQSLAAKHVNNQERDTWIELSKKMLAGEIDLESVPNFESEEDMSTVQPTLPVDAEEQTIVKKPESDGISFVAVTRGGDGVVAIMKIAGSDKPCTGDGLLGLAKKHPGHQESSMWEEIGKQIIDNTPIHEITTTHKAGMSNT